MTRKDTHRVDVFYRCTECKEEHRGGLGQMFCTSCGGAVRPIGYSGKLADLPTIHDKRV